VARQNSREDNKPSRSRPRKTEEGREENSAKEKRNPRGSSIREEIVGRAFDPSRSSGEQPVLFLRSCEEIEAEIEKGVDVSSDDIRGYFREIPPLGSRTRCSCKSNGIPDRREFHRNSGMQRTGDTCVELCETVLLAFYIRRFSSEAYNRSSFPAAFRSGESAAVVSYRALREFSCSAIIARLPFFFTRDPRRSLSLSPEGSPLRENVPAFDASVLSPSSAVWSGRSDYVRSNPRSKDQFWHRTRHRTRRRDC